MHTHKKTKNNIRKAKLQVASPNFNEIQMKIYVFYLWAFFVVVECLKAARIQKQKLYNSNNTVGCILCACVSAFLFWFIVNVTTAAVLCCYIAVKYSPIVFFLDCSKGKKEQKKIFNKKKNINAHTHPHISTPHLSETETHSETERVCVCKCECVRARAKDSDGKRMRKRKPQNTRMKGVKVKDE